MRLVGYFRHFVCRNALPIVACGVFSAFYLLSCPLGCSLRGISGIFSVVLPSQSQLAGYFRHFICCLALSVAACGVFQAFFLSSCPPNRNLRGIFGIFSVVLPSRLQLAGYFRYFFIVIPSLFEIPNYKVMNMPLLNVFCLQHLMSRSFEQAVHDCIADARGGKAL